VKHTEMKAATGNSHTYHDTTSKEEGHSNKWEWSRHSATRNKLQSGWSSARNKGKGTKESSNQH